MAERSGAKMSKEAAMPTRDLLVAPECLAVFVAVVCTAVGKRALGVEERTAAISPADERAGIPKVCQR